MNLLRLIIVLSLFCQISFCQNSDFEEDIENLLNAVGGTKFWKDAKGFHMLEIAHYANLKLPLVREFWVDFQNPRILQKTYGNGANSTQALNIDNGWTITKGQLEVWDDEKVNNWKSFWPGIPTRIFHLLAIKDPHLSYLVKEDRIDFFIDNAFVVWISCDLNGNPVAYGRSNNHAETHFLGKIIKYGNLNLWDSAYEPGGQWWVQMIDYVLLNDFTIDFESNQ
ncbi:hypothetical protein [Flagellimonas meishanensis]|uniref:hypothetical protein n=1 Tax=Flagellimonas meishanensis TaxID=2873264 RepID=UPI001CA6736C|nr:hypothetical protein [[Muricauda] meishanensis]